MHLPALIIASVLGIGTAAAQPPTAPDAAFIGAVQVFQRASRGVQSEVEPAVRAFEALARADSRNPVYAAYLGSAIATRANDAWMPWTRIKHAEQGLDHIDHALEMLKPEHDGQLIRGVAVGIETRLVAARTFLKLPDMVFHRRAAGRRLVADLLRHPAFAASPAPLRAAVHLAAAQAARDERPEDEVAQLKQVLSLADSGDSADQARARLKELGR
jgi:hypothetical protein